MADSRLIRVLEKIAEELNGVGWALIFVGCTICLHCMGICPPTDP